MEKYTDILARLQPGQSIARCEQGFQLREGKAALSIVFPRVESLLMWFDREYPAGQAGATEAPETGFYPYSLTCSCGRTLEGSIEGQGTAVYCECGQGIALSPQLVGHEFEPILNEHEHGIALSFEFMDEFPLVNEDGHDLADYVPTGWELIAPEHDYIAIDADGEVYSYSEQPTAGLAYSYSEQMWLRGVEFEKVTRVRLQDLANWQELSWQRPQK